MIVMRHLVIVLCISADSIDYAMASSESQIVAEQDEGTGGGIRDAERVAIDRERVGKELLVLIADTKRPVAERHDAARLLGRLQYGPAIEGLIRHVDLVDPLAVTTPIGSPEVTYPVVAALASYGDAAVPQIVEAYLSERDSLRKVLLSAAIRIGGSTDVALRYLRGTDPPDERDWLKKQNIEELQKTLISKR